MRIRQESSNRLVFIEPNIGHKIFFGIAAFGFGIATIGIAVSGGAPIAAAAIPAAICIGGFAGLRYGGKPNVTTLDRSTDLLCEELYSGSFSKPEIHEYSLSEFTGATIETNSVGSYRTYGVFLTRENGEPVQIGMYERWRRKMEHRREQITSFLEI